MPVDKDGGGPPNKWQKMQVSTTTDPNAVTSDIVLGCLNDQFPYSGAFALACSDGTFVFIGAYKG